MFVRVFLHDPSLKSTFAQNKRCRSFLPLQLLFWLNFKLPYEFLSFNRSNTSQNWSNGSLCCTALHCVAATPIPATVVVGELPPRVGDRAPNLAWYRAYPLPAFNFVPPPLLLPARARDEPSRAEPPSLAAPVTPRHPASILRAPTSLTSPRTSSTHPRARLSRFPGRIEPATAGCH